ncbi:hypothetical protein CGLO_00516 [Colletotrichum gloeosporioides Cg-14]|uniref:Uncharacterized protein n=1 Tax=Colletotrichum gloeosporioides (strain Cg-14) TaxID=1237896 RepID=T0L301_COLGC|nr:hypothetical protein CGLO_00516 [Colletotrichum gloeosporioides Cg-14]
MASPSANQVKASLKLKKTAIGRPGLTLDVK